MSDDGGTPRRVKKKSALSKLASRKGRHVDYSDDEDSEERDLYDGRKSRNYDYDDRDDIGSTSGRNKSSYSSYRGSSYADDEPSSYSKSKYSTSPSSRARYATDDQKYSKLSSSGRDYRYPVDADVEVRNGSHSDRYGHSRNSDDSDEGIEMNTGSSQYKSALSNSLSSRKAYQPERGSFRKLEPLNLSRIRDEEDEFPVEKKPLPKPRNKLDPQFNEKYVGRLGDTIPLRDQDSKSDYSKLRSYDLLDNDRTRSPEKYREFDYKNRDYRSNDLESSFKTKSKYYNNDLNDTYGSKYDDRLGDTATESELQREYETLLQSSKSKSYHGSLDDLENAEYRDKAMPLAHLGHQSPQHSQLRQQNLKKKETSSSLGSGIFSSQEHPWSSAIQRVGRDDELSQGSVSSTNSVLQQVTIREARNRGYMVGSITGGSALLGEQELERFFPDRKLRLFVGTWNMCEMKNAPNSIDDFLLPPQDEFVNHVYVIGTQESMSNRKEWESKLQECLGPQHCLLHSAANGVLYLSVFMHRDLLWHCSEPADGSVSTKLVNVKTKGAVAIAFTLFGTSFLFINSHLAHTENLRLPELAHDGMAEQRIADFNKICSSLHLADGKSSRTDKDYDVTELYDVVFWMGDLNFRLEKERERVSRKVEGIQASDIPTYEDLVETDELFRVRNMGAAFQHFQEGRINFRPTYKYDLNSDEYDTKKLRIPSYTDRVLFRTKKKNSVACLHYESADSIKISDHRPVYAQFEVLLRPGRDSVHLNAGRFNREIYLEGMRRRGNDLNTGNGSTEGQSVSSPKKMQQEPGRSKSSKVCAVQ